AGPATGGASCDAVDGVEQDRSVLDGLGKSAGRLDATANHRRYARLSAAARAHRERTTGPLSRRVPARVSRHSGRRSNKPLHMEPLAQRPPVFLAPGGSRLRVRTADRARRSLSESLPNHQTVRWTMFNPEDVMPWPAFRPLIIAHDVARSGDRSTAVVG